MTEEEFEQFEHDSYEYLKAQQERLETEYGIGWYEWWEYNQETCEFVFSDNEIPKVIASFQVVGSVSTVSNTWLWSWANPSIYDSVRSDLYLVKQFGKEHALKELTEEKWKADKIDGWGMTNIAAKLLAAKGAYCCPDENGFLFVIFTDLWRPPA